jgi:hypothetical protein
MTVARPLPLNAAPVLEIDDSVLRTAQHPAFRFHAEIDGYRVLTHGPAQVFTRPGEGRSLEDFLLNFSGLHALCLCVPQSGQGDVILSGDLYGLTQFYYRPRGRSLQLAFSPEPLSRDSAVDEISLFELFYAGTVYGSRTPFEQVSKNRPLFALRLRFEGGRLEVAERLCLPRGGPTTVRDFQPSLQDATAQVCRMYPQPLLAYSGGVDSDALLECLSRLGEPFSIIHYYREPADIRQAYVHARARHVRLHITVPAGGLASYNPTLQACAPHGNPNPRLEWADFGQSSGAGCLLTGQNADFMSQFGNTYPTSLHTLLWDVAVHGLTSHAAKTLATRYVQNVPAIGARLARFYQQRMVNLGGMDLELALLTVFACYHKHANPRYLDLGNLAFLDADLYEQWFDRMHREAAAIHDLPGLNLRQKLYLLLFNAYGLSGDVRCITAASVSAGLPNVQVYTTPPMVQYFFTVKPTLRDVVWPKSATHRMLRRQPWRSTSIDAILGDRVNVTTFPYGNRLAGPVSEMPLQDKLSVLHARYPWISRSSIYAIRNYLVTGWKMTISHLHALETRDFMPRSYQVAEGPWSKGAVSELFGGRRPWMSTEA